MKKQSIQFAIFGLILLTLSVMTKAHAAEDTFQLNVFSAGKLVLVAIYSQLPDCLLDGMTMKKRGYDFECKAAEMSQNKPALLSRFMTSKNALVSRVAHHTV